MERFTAAAAQSASVKGDVAANVRMHAAFVRAAVAQKADLIVFPELSLTGYEPEIAMAAAVDPEDVRLAELVQLARRHGITIAAGAPLRNPGGKPCIGALILSPDRSSVYRKTHLYPGEEAYFAPSGGAYRVWDIKGIKVGPAICADIDHASHPAEAAKQGAALYAAGVLIMNGYDTAAANMRNYAVQHKMTVLMANHAAPTGGYVPAGGSAIWDPGGTLLAAVDGPGTALVLATKEKGQWMGKSIGI